MAKKVEEITGNFKSIKDIKLKPTGDEKVMEKNKLNAASFNLNEAQRAQYLHTNMQIR